MWFTENPWPPILILGIVACVCLGSWYSHRKLLLLIGALVTIIAAVATYYVERAIITDGEQVEANVRSLTAAFQRKDRTATLAFISPNSTEWRDVVTSALEWVDVDPDLDVKDLQVTLYGENSQALSHFRANGTVKFKGFSAGFQPSRWELRWQKEGTEWKIIDVVRLHPLKDQRMQVFDQRQ
ncbi:MAG: hypothetical protein ACKV0T_04280 [Planctomycetales bacterium]